MKKLGGVMLIILGAVLILYGILHITDVLMGFLSTEDSYSMPHIAGRFLITVLVIALGSKAITKGRRLFSITKPDNVTSGDEQ